MKIYYVFDTDNENDIQEIKIYKQATELLLSLLDMQEFLRKKIKYENLPEQEYTIFKSITDKFYEILQENKVDLE